MSRHIIRAEEFRVQAAAAREKLLAAVLPQVRSVLERSAESWEAMAKMEDAFELAADLRRAGKAAASPDGVDNTTAYPFAQAGAAP